MMTLPCVTTTTGTGRGCRVLGEHLSTCRGIELDGTRAIECAGCLPQPSAHGLLCESCYLRLQDALDVAVDSITHMRSIERGPVPDGPNVQTSKPGSKMILPVSWLTADEAWSVLRELAFRSDPLDFLQVDKRGTTAYGFGSRDSIKRVRDHVALAVDLARGAELGRLHVAQLAVRFYRVMQHALSAFPFEEAAQPFAYATCRDCGNRTLERRPPLEHLDPITVRCVFPGCGAIYHPALVEYDLATYRETLESADAA